VKFTRNLPIQTRRDAWVEVNLGQLEQNTRRIRQQIPPEVALMAIVKADAYGHGAVMCIPTLEASGVQMVGVASMDEALQIRRAGLEIPILVIGGIPDWAVHIAAENHIQLTVFEENHLESLKNAYTLTGQPVKIHIKVDTGMHRIGVDYRQAAPFIQQVRTLPYLQLEGVFTHLASAEDPQVSQLQLERWKTVLSQIDPLPPCVHVANSGGALRYPESHYSLVRMGIGFFGYGEQPQPTPTHQEDFLPVMGLKARIIHLQDVPAGEGVSYSYTYHAPPESSIRVATLPLGYADGVPRILSNQIEALLHGVRVPQIGAITMDQMMLDVSQVPDAAIGESVTLLGAEQGPHGTERITLTDWAEKAKTLEYELMCGLRVRLPKTYTRD
jgi:alanine racemase